MADETEMTIQEGQEGYARHGACAKRMKESVSDGTRAASRRRFMLVYLPCLRSMKRINRTYQMNRMRDG